MGHISEAFNESDTLETAWDDIEDILLGSDIGLPTTSFIIQELKNQSPTSIQKDYSDTFSRLRTILTEMVNIKPNPILPDEVGPETKIILDLRSINLI